MKQRPLLFGLVLLAGGYAFAAESPFTGSTPEEALGKEYYLYQVETGTWLQANMSKLDQWTTHAELGDVGFDVELRKLDGFNEGYQIFCNFTNNGELNGSDQDRFFLDQGDRQLTEWIFEPVAGAENQYKIMVKARQVAEDRRDRDGVAEDRYIGARPGEELGGLSDNPTETTWQLVSREERLEKAMAQAKATGEPADISFLIPWNDRGRNDQRDRQWEQIVINDFGGGDGFGGKAGYPVREAWHRMNHTASITLENLPKGTYSFSVQAYYRDTEMESDELLQRHVDGTERLRAKYSAGVATGTVMSIMDDTKTSQGGGFEREVELPDGRKIFVPDNMDQAGEAMIAGNYINEFIETPVTDGKLRISISKTENDDDCHRDWLIYKRFFLRYDSEDVKEDIDGIRGELRQLIDQAYELPSHPLFAEVIASAEETHANATSSSAFVDAKANLQNWINIINTSRDVIDNFRATTALHSDDEAEAKYNAAASRAEFENALKTLRFAYFRANADTHENVFEGSEPKEGKFYLYNVGQKQFLAGGSDWGAHAALALPGVELTLEEGENGTDFHIETGLFNGDNHYLNYRGYMDAGKGGKWRFSKVPGKSNVYHILQADYPDVYVAWNPWGSVDAGQNDDTNVCTEMRDLKEDDLNAQWILVSREERDEMLANATVENPVDATYLLKSPNFSQRENARDVWGGAEVPGYGDNRYDFVAEIFNSADGKIQQEVTLPKGVYEMTAQGFFRNGNENAMWNEDQDIKNAEFFAGEDETRNVAVPGILTGANTVPGEGRKGEYNDWGTLVTYEVPDMPHNATSYFKAGQYKATMKFVSDGETATLLGVKKVGKDVDGDWVVVDNFRLTYYGVKSELNGDSISTGVEGVEAEAVNDSKIYNIQGLEVKDASEPGFYIKNGKKFVVVK